MPQLTATAAEGLPPAQAADLLGVVDREAAWRNLRDDPSAGDASPAARLRRLQAAFESFRAAAAEYTTRYRTDRFPALTPNGPDRVAAWCRTVRTLLRLTADQPGVGAPAHAVRFAVRMADRIAARVGVDPVPRASDADAPAAAVADLDAIIRWCDAHPGRGD